MKALVLAGGTGSRLRPLTYAMPKQLVPVANTPVLRHCLENIRAMGVTDVGMIVGDHAEQLRDACGDGAALGLRITYLWQDRPAGLAHCVLVAEDFLDGDDFVMYLGDNILVGDLRTVADEFRHTRPDARLLLAKVADPTGYGVVDLGADGRPRALVEKSPTPPSDLAIIGVYFFTSAIVDAARRITPSGRGELEITDAVQSLLDRGATVSASLFGGVWKDTGSVEDLLDCNRLLLDGLTGRIDGEVDAATVVHGPVVVEAGARVTRSVLHGPAVIGAGSVVTDSRIGPYTSVGAYCTLLDTTVDDSILLDRAVVHRLHGLNGSLIGRDTEIRLADTPRHRLVVGDRTRLELAAG